MLKVYELPSRGIINVSTWRVEIIGLKDFCWEIHCKNDLPSEVVFFWVTAEQSIVYILLFLFPIVVRFA